MKSATSVALACLLAVARAHPRGHVWITDSCYPNPGNTDNECSKDLDEGFDWTELDAGPFSSYGGLDFSGFTCLDSAGDNDLGKYIEGKISKGQSSGLQISADGGLGGFSITDFYLSTSKEADVDIIYGMPDGSSCRNVASCSSETTRITNEQCGGAVSVSFHLSEHSEEEECNLGIHSIEFDCGPANVPKTTSSRPVIPTSTGVSPGSTSSLIHSSSIPVVTGGPSTTPRMTTSTVYSTQEVTITSCAPTVVSCPAHSTTVVTSTIAVSTTVCPVTETETSPATLPSSVAPGSKTSTPLIPTAPSTPTGNVPATTPAPSSVVPGSSSPPEGSVTTVVTYETVTTCPVTTTITSGGSEIPTTYSTASTVTLTSTSTVCTRCAPTGTPTGNVPAETTPSPTGVSPGSSSAPGGGSVTTVVTYETVTTCPVTTTITSGGSEIPTTYSTVSTVTRTSTSTVCTKCAPTGIPTGNSPVTGSESETTVAPPSPTSPSTTPSAPCPNSVPKCINTWLTLMPKCKSNSDSSCFCPDSKFTNKVISCIQAWGASDEEIQAALSYFTGICGAYVPQNPGIVTAIPTTITLVPTVAPPSGVAGVTPTASESGIVPPAPTQGPITQAPPATTITYSSYTVTVPQVQFTTGAGTGGEVGLIPATAASTTSSRPLFSTLFTAHSTGPAPSQSSVPVQLTNGVSGTKIPRGFWAAVSAVFGLFVFL
ncbi:extracellular serine-threonine rich protein [Aspergillus sclerotialis]|uniref:Extracellular serine-threonine rich protein n=1 Tax=Aspergillus sclerotialis TaxID=2070753 RepID=A0A3A2ZHA0_9EURO|nr:extracellular serine-threonine rich protein [Aspergillus sclerotialis]